ncbi:MAG: TIGR04282 family arsenosugar biosynthesis glycosyltransferase [Psychroflexus sp.]|nr:TIGR04282 family arsenosugar biosynthesis glycosyltransferase [Psychroflexus sp.]MDN6309088.1 TIGR04282 family arsenosugar biosynthesis glycosyltransferase [Psychroflexus sp.]
MTKEKNVLLIFARHPELGKCKTRLAKTVGDAAALEIYKYLVERTAEVVKNVKSIRQVWYADEVRQNDMWSSDFFEKKQQVQGNLGQKMQDAFASAFAAGAQKVVIVGTDIHDLDAGVIQEAFDKLNTHDLVIGPATDGGYYLLGMKTLKKAAFQLKAWSTSSVFMETIHALKTEKISILERRNDVDYYEDIQGLPIFETILKKHK